MKMVLLGALFGLVVILLYGLLTDDSTPQAGWNDNCEYGNEYMMPDGTVVQHSECK